MTNVRRIISVVLVAMLIITMATVGFTSAFALSADGIYVVAGSGGLCTSEWDPTDTNNQMTYNAEKDIYEKIYTDVAADTYQFKVTSNYQWGEGEFNEYGDASYGGDNVVFDVEEDGSTVVIGFDGEKVLVDVVASYGSESNPEDYQYDIVDEQVTITGYIGTESNITIPSEIDGYPVTTIGHSAFFENEVIEKVMIPDGVTSIVHKAFYNCPNLKSVYVSGSVEYILQDVFMKCENLESITLEEGIVHIADRAFCECKKLESVVLPDSVEYIGNYLFATCDSLKEVQLPSGLTDLAQCTFWECTSLTFVELPDGVTSIGSSMFYGCSNLYSVAIPESVTEIATNVFIECENLSEIYYGGILDNWSNIVGVADIDFSSVTIYDKDGNFIPAEPEETIPTEPTDPTDPADPTDPEVPSEPATEIDGERQTFFVNSDGWENVYAFAWREIDGVSEFGVEWPGSLMTKVGKTTEGDYVYSVVFDVTYDHIVFNNNNGTQSDDLEFKSGQYYDWQDKCWYESIDLDQSSAEEFEEISVYAAYCINSLNWDNMNAYFWSNYGNIGEWPGVQMTKTDSTHNGNDVYKITVFSKWKNVIFSNGYGEQTDDLSFNIGQYYDLATERWYTSLDDVGNIEPTEPTEPSVPDVTDNEMTLYFTNVKNWSTVYLYYIGSAESFVEWPGKMMEFAFTNDYGQSVYKCSIPYDTISVIFNDGNGVLTEEIYSVYDRAGFYIDESLGQDEYGNWKCGIWEYSPEIEDPAPEVEVAGHSITLTGNIGMNFFFDISEDILADEDAKVTFTYGDTTYTVSVNDGVFENGYYKYTCEVPAKDIATDINCKIVSSADESETFTYSIKEYAEVILSNPDVYVNEQELVKAMLNYATYAQLYFNYNTDNLANDTEYMTDEDKQLELYDFTGETYLLEGEVGSITYYGSTLSLKSELAMKHYFVVDEGVDVEAIDIVCDYPITFVKNGNLYELIISNIPAHLMGEKISVTVNTLTLEYSIYSYGALAQNSGNTALWSVVSALATYANEAALYAVK